jgi:YYY domain-containing protein
MLLDLVRWWLVVQALALLALPLTTWFFGRMPDRGYSFAKPFALLLTGYGAWLVSMLGVGAFSRPLLWGSALVVGVLGIAAQGRHGVRQMLADLRQRWSWIALQEVLFAVALCIGIVLRWRDFFGGGPALSHTEQPMDLTFLSGILASPQFPPQDPWLSSYPINYYYLGYLLVAALIRLAGVSVGVGFTLGMATIFAFTATGVAGIVRNLIELTERRETRDERREAKEVTQAPPIQNPKRGRPLGTGTRIQNFIWPVVAAVLVVIAGNQVGALQLLAGSEKVVALQPSQLAAAMRNGLGERDTLDLGPAFPVGPGLFDDATLTPADKIEDFNAWWPSRAVWDTLTNEDGQTSREYAITEFPFFSFLLGDLHPHVLSLPWSILAVAVALNVLLRSRAPDFRTRREFGRLALTGIVLGGLYAINSWDLPTYLLLYLGALALLYLRLAPSPRHFFWAHFAQQAGATILASYLLYFPFHLSFTAPTEGFPLGLAPARTGLTEFLVIFGLFFVPLLAFVAATFKHPEGTRRSTFNVASFAFVGFLLVLGIVVGWSLFFLLPVALLACLAAYERRAEPGVAFALWAFAVGALVVWGTDVVYLRDPYSSPRMNTIFKFYYQVWLVWGTLAAYALWSLLRHDGTRWQRALWLVPFALLAWGAAVYPALAPAEMPISRTLDGLAYVKQRYPNEAAAMQWIMRNTANNAVIVQAPGRAYNSSTARIASATGRPTVVGWTQHERIWRSGQAGMIDEVRNRENDVIALYTTADAVQAQALLDQYDVEYVYVGPQERALVAQQGAPADALTKFDSTMQRVFEQDDVVIYGRQ